MSSISGSGTSVAGTGSGNGNTSARPRRGTRRWRHVANGAALVGILIVAGVVAQTTPTEEVWQGPIAVRGEVGQTLTGRNIEASIDRVRLASAVTASTGWSGPTSGVWVVVDAKVAAVVTDSGVSLGTAQLQVGDTLYTASERPDIGSIEGRPLSVGIFWGGPLMFEVPKDLPGSAAAKTAEVRLASNDDPRTDSIIVVPVDLTSLPVDASVTTDAPVWGNR